MDLGTAITGIICVGICASPFVLTGISKKKHEKEFLTTLKNIATKHNSVITQHEICGNYAIGIDNNNKTLAFVTKIENNFKEQFVDLTSVIDCKIANISRSTKSGKIIQKLYLQLTHSEWLKQEDILEFYNADTSYQLSGEIESIEQWNKTINKLLTH